MRFFVFCFFFLLQSKPLPAVHEKPYIQADRKAAHLGSSNSLRHLSILSPGALHTCTGDGGLVESPATGLIIKFLLIPFKER